MISKIIRFLIVFAIGIVYIIAAKEGWKYPGLFWGWREMKYGEIFNKILGTIIGITIIITSFFSFFT